MSMKRCSVVEVKASLLEHIRSVQRGERILITRKRIPVAALVPADDLEWLERTRTARSEGGLAGIAGGLPGSDELVQILDSSRRTI